ncbi:unnamed protein product [Linum tenue]|uniref:Uncharacterized protein n=1 Tax=Linum tenue TaxID=586396 RepID=A0AAV0R6M3_9ROSI|nr:unnamed protein product [Linum tenue]CAI0553096.1 unnamed protein product [Linum tenue]
MLRRGGGRLGRGTRSTTRSSRRCLTFLRCHRTPSPRRSIT